MILHTPLFYWVLLEQDGIKTDLVTDIDPFIFIRERKRKHPTHKITLLNYKKISPQQAYTVKMANISEYINKAKQNSKKKKKTL